MEIQIPRVAGRWRAGSGRATNLAPRRTCRCCCRERRRSMAGEVYRGIVRLSVPARRPRAGRSGHRQTRNAIQLLRVRTDSRFDQGDSRFTQGNRRYDAPGRRHRLRLLESSTLWRAGRHDRIDGIGPAVVHAHLECHVRNITCNELAPRRDDGDLALRSSRHRGVHCSETRTGRANEFQLVGFDHRRIHAGGGR